MEILEPNIRLSFNAMKTLLHILDRQVHCHHPTKLHQNRPKIEGTLLFLFGVKIQISAFSLKISSWYFTFWSDRCTATIPRNVLQNRPKIEGTLRLLIEILDPNIRLSFKANKIILHIVDRQVYCHHRTKFHQNRPKIEATLFLLIRS
jgi:hypothetical protein